MSRFIDHTAGPLTPEDRQYLLDRGRRHLVIQNDRMVEAGEFDGPAEEPVDWEAEVKELNVNELKAELQARGLDTKGSRDVLQARLIQAGPEED